MYIQKNKIIVFFICSFIFMFLVGCRGRVATEDFSSIDPSLENEVISDEVILENSLNSFQLYFSASIDGDQKCMFGDLGGCRVFTVPVSAGSTDSDSFIFSLDEEGFEELGADMNAVLPAISPNGESLAFRAVGNGGLESEAVYVYSVTDGAIMSVTDGLTVNNSGHWPFWLNDQELLISNTNDCQNGEIGCNKQSLFEDILLFKFDDYITSVISVQNLLGGKDTALDFDSDACSFSNPVVDQSDSSLIAFHTSPVDGMTDVHTDGKCPFIQGSSGLMRDSNSQPLPVVLDMDQVALYDSVSELKEGVDFWLFDLEGAGINGCAHLAFADNGEIICIEQGTQESDNICSDSGLNLSQCEQGGGSLIKRNKLYGFGLKDGMYRNVNEGSVALFEHAHPSELPESDRYWNKDESCQLYATKYVKYCGENTVVATVQCTTENSSQKSGYEAGFSRIMLINYDDIENPTYFDVTSWVEDVLPELEEGEASGFSAACQVDL